MIQVHDDKIPLFADEKGMLRVAGTRVLLDSIVDMYDDGASVEEIVEQFDTLSLADAHLVLGYYLRHKDEIQAHLAEEDKQVDARRAEIEAEYSSKPLRSRLRKLKESRTRAGS